MRFGLSSGLSFLGVLAFMLIMSGCSEGRSDGDNPNPASSSAPTLDFGQLPINAGLVSGAGELAISLVGTNRGSTPVRITMVAASCGCITSSVDKNTVEPGEAAVFDVRIASSTRHGILKEFLTITLDPGGVLLSVPITYEREQRVSISPSKVNLGKIRRGARPHATFSVFGSLSELKSLRAPAGDSRFELELGSVAESAGPSSSMELSLRVNSDQLGFGEVKEVILLPWSDGLSITVSATVVGDVELIPEALLFRFTSAEAGQLTERVQIVSDRELVGGVSVSPSHEAISARWLAGEKVLECILDTAKLPHDAEVINGTKKLTIENADPPDLVLPVYIVRRSNS